MKNNLLIRLCMVLAVIVVAVPAFNCSSNQSSLKILDHSMTVQKFSGEKVQGLAVVSGQAQNTGTAAIAAASITIEFYDKDMKPLNTSSTVFENLQPNATWYFSVQFMGPDAWKVSKYKVIDSTK